MHPTATLFKRAGRNFKLTTKRVPSGYYKGNRTGRMGDHTKHGGYKVDYDRVRSYVVPEDLTNFPLTPFVTRNMPVKPGKRADGTGPPTGALYLARWKWDNGDD